MSNSPIDQPISIPVGSLNIDDSSWEFVEIKDGYVVTRAPFERYGNGVVSYVYQRAPMGADELIAANGESFKDSETQKTRFNDKSAIGQKISSIPLNVFFDQKNQLAEKIKEGDRDHMKWFLNSEDGRPWRTFRGRV